VFIYFLILESIYWSTTIIYLNLLGLIGFMLILLLQAIYFFLPAYFANMAPLLFSKVNILARPVNSKYFGTHKTWRGIIGATIVGQIVYLIQYWVYSPKLATFAIINYHHYPVYFGAVLGLGAILGDLVKSYYKRKEGIKEGHSWIPWDQLDFVFGAIIFGFIVYVPHIKIVVALLLVSPVLHVSANYLGYLLKFKKSKF
jgi:CDP-2,3-bis-(O-geranylgeranyl)-sn-glycerol synthase